MPQIDRQHRTQPRMRLDEIERARAAEATPPSAPSATPEPSTTPDVARGRAGTAVDGRLLMQNDPTAMRLQSTLSAPGDLAAAVPGPQLREGYSSLQTLSNVLPRKDERFSPATPQGRAALSIALAIGGSESHGKDTVGTKFFTERGGTGNNMLGFAQFNLAHHRKATNTPEKYSKFLADILTGDKPMPDSKSQANFAGRLADAVDKGQVNSGADLHRWLQQQGFGGSNWEGIDHGWGRVPGLGDDLVNFMKGANARS